MLLETIDDFLASRDRRVAIDNVDPIEAEHMTHDFGKAELHVPMFDEHEHTLTRLLNAV